MTLDDAWKSVTDYTCDASSCMRRLGFAGGGVAWLIVSIRDAFTALSIMSFVLLAAYFWCDLMQYLLGAKERRKYLISFEKANLAKSRAKRKRRADDFQWPSSMDEVAYTMWWAKFAALSIAWSLIIIMFAQYMCERYSH